MASKSTLERLLGVSPEVFATDYWGKKTLLRAGGGKDLLDSLGLDCTRDELFAVIRQTAALRPPVETFTLNVGREHSDFASKETEPAVLRKIPVSDLEQEFEAGFSIIAQAIAHENLGTLAAR
jgi:hypothetical protein